MEKIEFETLERVKLELMKYLWAGNEEYVIEIPIDKWHEIFKTDECNKLKESWEKK